MGPLTTTMAIVTIVMGILFPVRKGTMVFAGDAMMHQSQLDDARRPGGQYDFTDCFTGVDSIIKAADVAVVNLETTLGGRNYTGYPCFCSPDAWAVALKDAGFDVFLTANNHTLDRGERGLRRTIAVLDSLKVRHLGTYGSREERRERLPMICDVGGIRVGLVNYTYGTNGISLPTGSTAIVDYDDDRSSIAVDISRARLAGAEVVVACMHWGVEYEKLPRRPIKEFADWLMEKGGADVVIGSHPHVIQPVEHRKDTGRVVAYSLGNFISGMRTTDTRGGILVTLHLEAPPLRPAHVSEVDYTPVFTVVDPHYRLVRVGGKEASRSGVWATRCRAFWTAAKAIFDAHNVDVALQP